MKYKITLIVFFIGYLVNAQTIDYNTKKGFIAEGYDVVAYFNNSVKKGSSKYVTSFEGVDYKFSSEQNLNTFKNNPKMYVPQYGGYCAYALASYGKKVTINPETFEIRDGKLYLFYNSWGNNTFKSWLKESPNDLKLKADKNWEKVKYIN